MDIIKVSGTSRTSAVAGAIAGVFRDNKRAEVQAIGAGAVNQAVKALILAKGYLNEDGYDVVFAPEFVDVEIEDKVRTAIKLVVENREGLAPNPDVEELDLLDQDEEPEQKYPLDHAPESDVLDPSAFG